MEKPAIEELEARIIENIDSLLAKTGKRQKDLAESLGIDEGTFKKRKYRLKNNEKRKHNQFSFSVYELGIISDFFDVPMLSLLSDTAELVACSDMVDTVLDHGEEKTNYDLLRRFVLQGLPKSSRAPKYLVRPLAELAKAVSKYVKSDFSECSIGIPEFDQDPVIRKQISSLSKATEEYLEFQYYISKLESFVYWTEVYKCAQHIADSKEEDMLPAIIIFVKTAEIRNEDFRDLLGFFEFKVDTIVDSNNILPDEKGIDTQYTPEAWKTEKTLFHILNVAGESEEIAKLITRTLKHILNFTGVYILPDIVEEYIRFFVDQKPKNELISKLVKSIRNDKLSHAIGVAFDTDMKPETKTKIEARRYLEERISELKSDAFISQKTTKMLDQLFSDDRLSRKINGAKYCLTRLLSAKQNRSIRFLCEKAYALNIFEIEIPVGRLSLRIPEKTEDASELRKQVSAQFNDDLKKNKFEPTEPVIEYLLSKGFNKRMALSYYEDLKSYEPERRKRGRPRKATEQV